MSCPFHTVVASSDPCAPCPTAWFCGPIARHTPISQTKISPYMISIVITSINVHFVGLFDHGAAVSIMAAESFVSPSQANLERSMSHNQEENMKLDEAFSRLTVSR